jgi:biopolymer transport protein ExbB
MEIYQLLLKGGIIMIPIGLLSLVGLAIVIERFFSLKKSVILPVGLKERIKLLIREDKTEEAGKILKNHASPFGRLLYFVIKNSSFSRTEMIQALEERGNIEAHNLGKSVEYIGVISSTTPLLGLLGTVTGMIGVFRDVMNQAGLKGVNPSLLAGGIWEALLTTAAGLTVAIPLFLAYRYLALKVDSSILELEEETLDVVNYLYPGLEEGISRYEKSPKTSTTSSEQSKGKQ